MLHVKCSMKFLKDTIDKDYVIIMWNDSPQYEKHSLQYEKNSPQYVKVSITNNSLNYYSQDNYELINSIVTNTTII